MQIGLHISQPIVLSKISWYFDAEITQDARNNHKISWERANIQEKIYLRRELGRDEGLSKASDRLMKRLDLVLEFDLEPYLRWRNGLEKYLAENSVGYRSNDTVVLKWWDVQANPRMQWSLPITRAPSKQMFPLEEVPAIGGSYQWDNAFVTEKKSRKLFGQK